MDYSLIFVIFLLFVFIGVIWYIGDLLSKTTYKIYNTVCDKIDYPVEITRSNVYDVADKVMKFFEKYDLTKTQKDILEYSFNNKNYEVVMNSINTIKNMKDKKNAPKI